LAATAFYPKVDRAVVSLLSKPGWSLGYVSAVDCEGQTIWIADGHRGDGKRFLVHADDSKRLWRNDNYVGILKTGLPTTAGS